MGKRGRKGESTATSGKQEVISMANLEVVSEENFQRRLEGMTSTVGACAHCITERRSKVDNSQTSCRENNQDMGGKSRKRRRANKARSSRIIPRASSPIVVHLEDSIKVCSKNSKSSRDIGKSPLTIENNRDTTSIESTPSSTSSVLNTEETGDNSTKYNKNHRNRSKGGHDSILHSNKETVVSLNNTQYYSGKTGGPNHHHSHHHHYHHNRHQGSSFHHHHRNCHHISKNFNAFLSAIERVHQKDPKSTSTKLENLVEYAREKTKKDKFYLNNAMVDYCQTGNVAFPSALAARFRRRSHLHLLNDKNVELICNNLSRKSSLTESEEDMSSCSSSSSLASSASSSANSSSEDNESEIGGTVCVSSASSSCSSSEADELSQEQLRSLTQFVTGFSVTKYDCAPDECPECLAAYYDFVSACTTPNYMSEQSDSCSDSDETDSDESETSRLELTTSELYPVTVKSAGKIEISVAKLFKKKRRSSDTLRRNRRNKYRQKATHTPPNGVFVDLVDSDVSLSIEYHTDSRRTRSSSKTYSYNYDDSDSSSNNNNTSSTSTGSNHHQYHHHHHHVASSASTSTSQNVPSFWDWFYYPLGTYGWLPYSLPYCLVPMYYLPYQLYSTIPKPIMVPRDTPCLKSQRLCYVPAQEIKNFTASQPPQRPWIPLSHPERNKPIALYTVMCYNVLCDKYATRQLYGYCPSWALNWEYRKKGIIEEIRHYSADIISLQEVETDQFYNFFLPELKRDGYDGIFSPKSRARTMTESERKHVDGCAIFYRTAKFSLIKEHLVEFNQLAMTTADGSHDMLNRVMTKDNIGLAALFETKETIWENGLPPEGQVNQPLLVATCHVHWDPEFSDVKLIQTMMLMSELKNILDETQTSFRPGSTTAPDVNNMPIILCGDLNSLPNSGVLEFLTTSKVAATHVDFKDMGYDACLQKLTTSDHKDFYTHSFKLAAAYNKDMIPYTNYTYDFKGVIDYIFYSRELMRPLGVLGPLDENWFTENKVLGCPHPHIPSDHLPLLVELEMQIPPASSNQRSNSALHNLTSVRPR